MTAPVRIEVDAARPAGTLRPLWSWFGYDEPNYTTMPNGRKLLRDLAALHRKPVFVRAHNLLTSGDGTPALKWGSTGVYDEDASGAPRYSWPILDGIFDAYLEAGIVPFVQLGFMPEALSVAPDPYQHSFPRGGITTGWAYPPKDFGKWGALVSAVAQHFMQRYGRERAQSWPWELWNEPDGLYWRGTVEEFCQLFEVTARALRRVLPEVRLGGPHTCGPFSTKAGGPFLRKFLEHCARTPDRALRPDILAFHAKGKPTLSNGQVRMGLASQLNDIDTGLKIVSEFPELAGIPIVIGESDPEGCAACPASTHPENAYRDGALYAAYVAEHIFRTYELAERHGATIEGAVTWAFEFEGEPYFAGYRELATNGIAKPVLNAFRMLGLLGETRLQAASSGALSLDSILKDGVRNAPDVNVLAARDAGHVSALVWNYHDDAAGSEPARIELTVRGLSGDSARCAHFRIDEKHSNAHTEWIDMGRPQAPRAEQYSRLERAGDLQLVEPPRDIVAKDGVATLTFELPRHGLSLIHLSLDLIRVSLS